MHRKRVFPGLLAIALILASCSAPTNTPDDQQNDEVEIIPNPQAHTVPPLVDELSCNYALLRYYYSYADTELGPYAEYAGTGNSANYDDVLAMYDDMSDPWTRYWTPATAGAILDQLTNSGEKRKLVGMTLRVEESAGADLADALYVARVWINSPAEAVGLLKGDRIIRVNGTDLTAPPVLKGKDLLAQYLELAAGDTVSFTLLRQGDTVEVPSITKRVMRPPTVYLDYVDTIPVIQITEFSPDSGYDETAADNKSNTSKELRAALTLVKNGKYPVGIIDLRGNPGGSVNQCYASIEELVAGGIYIRSEEHTIIGASQSPVIIKTGKRAKPGGLGEDIRWIFLADANSASAAEIMLFAVKNSRPETHIVGETSYGKGIGEYIMQTNAKGLAAITALQFFDENWNTYHRTGIVPDEPVNSAGALEKAVDYALASLHQEMRSIHGAAPVDRDAIHALNSRLVEQRVPSDGVHGGAWKVLSPNLDRGR